MNKSEVIAYCLSKRGATLSYPFGEEVMVFKVIGKIFALIPTPLDQHSMSLKGDPDHSQLLRTTFPNDIVPAYHLNKRHWNTIQCAGGLEDDLIMELIDESYDLVVQKLTQKQKAELASITHDDK